MEGKAEKTQDGDEVGGSLNFQSLKTQPSSSVPPGVTGYLKMDSNGDRETDFSLWDMDPETGAFRVRLCPSKTVPTGNDILPSYLPPWPYQGICLLCSHTTMLGHLQRALDKRDTAPVWGSNQNYKDSQA